MLVFLEVWGQKEPGKGVERKALYFSWLPYDGEASKNTPAPLPYGYHTHITAMSPRNRPERMMATSRIKDNQPHILLFSLYK